jgi:hypothetical protein
MSRHLTSLFLAMGLLAFAGCRGDLDTKAPSEKEEEDLVGVSNADPEGPSEEEQLEERFGAREELPAIQPAKEVCKGKGKARTCSMVDPAPEVTAAHGTRQFLQGYRWGMSVDDVMSRLRKDIEAEYDDKQAKATSAVEQDKNRDWKRLQLEDLTKARVKFEKAARHKWGVSAIQFDFEDDANEEMVWVKSSANLKKFFFFKDGELWKIVFAYSQDSWPGKAYPEVVEEKFKKWFGVSPAQKVKQDPNTQAVVLRYDEWLSRDGEFVRAFDMTAVHGVAVVAFIDKNAESRIGERLPNVGERTKMDEDVNNVLGGSDICYDKDGNIIEDAAKCAELMGQ